MQRKRFGSHKSRKVFHKGQKVHKLNLRNMPMRGGFRL